jgi:hypothetical protein
MSLKQLQRMGCLFSQGPEARGAHAECVQMLRSRADRGAKGMQEPGRAVAGGREFQWGVNAQEASYFRDGEHGAGPPRGMVETVGEALCQRRAPTLLTDRGNRK